MNEQEQIKALAELDGQCQSYDGIACANGNCIHCGKSYAQHGCKPYLTSYDAIIPLIHLSIGSDTNKANIFICILRSMLNQDGFEICTMDCFVLMTATPSQLCEALLRATGKWKDS